VLFSLFGKNLPKIGLPAQHRLNWRDSLFRLPAELGPCSKSAMVEFADQPTPAVVDPNAVAAVFAGPDGSGPLAWTTGAGVKCSPTPAAMPCPQVQGEADAGGEASPPHIVT
jgi:hypothetical protein